VVATGCDTWIPVDIDLSTGAKHFPSNLVAIGQ